MKPIICFILIFGITISVKSQGNHCSNYDTSLYVECVVIKWERSMKVGNWGTAIRTDFPDTAYIPLRIINRQTKEMINLPVLIGKDIWTDLKRNKKY